MAFLSIFNKVLLFDLIIGNVISIIIEGEVINMMSCVKLFSYEKI